MAEFEKRFRNFSKEETEGLIKDLEDAVTVQKRELLSTDELEQLLMLLPANYFRLSTRKRIQDIKRTNEEFPERIASIDDAAQSLAKELVEASDSGDDDWLEDTVLAYFHLSIRHPALWYRLHQALRKMNRLDLALKIEPEDKGEPFKKP